MRNFPGHTGVRDNGGYLTDVTKEKRFVAFLTAMPYVEYAPLIRHGSGVGTVELVLE